MISRRNADTAIIADRFSSMAASEPSGNTQLCLSRLCAPGVGPRATISKILRHCSKEYLAACKDRIRSANCRLLISAMLFYRLHRDGGEVVVSSPRLHVIRPRVRYCPSAPASRSESRGLPLAYPQGPASRWLLRSGEQSRCGRCAAVWCRHHRSLPHPRLPPNRASGVKSSMLPLLPFACAIRYGQPKNTSSRIYGQRRFFITSSKSVVFKVLAIVLVIRHFFYR